MGKIRYLGVIVVLATAVTALPAPTTVVAEAGPRLRTRIECAPPAPLAAVAARTSAPEPRAIPAAQDFSAAYSAPLTPQRMIPDEEYVVAVEVTNTTTKPLPKNDFVLSYRWRLPDGTDYTRPSNRVETALPGDLAPGATAKVDAHVKAPIDTDLGNQRESFVLDWDLRNKRTGKWLSETDQVPPLSQPVTAEYPTSNQLGLEKFYQYNGIGAGAGWTATVNQFSGNAVVGYNAFTNPTRGPSAFVRLNYNSLDNSNSYVGQGWSLTTSSLHRLGSPLQFHNSLLGDPKYPAKITLVDGDGTSHLFELNKNGSQDKTKWTYDSPAGVHLYLRRAGGTDDERTWVMTQPDSTETFFDEDGHQTALADKNGNELRFTYARTTHGNRNTGVLTEITDATGRRVLTLDYYQSGDDFFSFAANVKVFGHALANTSIIGQLRSITDVNGRRLTFTYSDRGQLQEVVDGADAPGQKVFAFFYADPGDNDSKLVRVNDALGHGTQVTYFGDQGDRLRKQRVRTVVDRRGNNLGFDYTDADGDDGSSIAATFLDANNHATRSVLDGYGRPVKETNAKGEVIDLAWDDDNNVVLLRENNGATRTWKYDPKTGYPLEIRDAEANANDTAPVKLGYRTKLGGHTAELADKTSPEGHKWSFGQDDRGNLTTVTDPKGFTTRYTYDELGQLLTSTDAGDHTTTFSDYDPVGYPRRTTDALGCTSTAAYDVIGNVVSTTDARQKTSIYLYDIFNRPAGSRVPKDADAGKYIVTPGPRYDENDNILATTAPNGAVTTTVYDPMDRVASVTEPKDDPASRQTRTSTYEYDTVGNLVRSTQPRGVLTRDDPNDFSTRFSYDELNRLLSTTDAAGGVSTVGYDDVGNAVVTLSPLKNASPDPNDFTTRYTYDRNHRITKTTDAAGQSISLTYDRDDNLVARTDQDGNRSVTSFDERGLVTETRVPHADGVERVTRFSYDAVGNRTKVTSPKGVETTDDPDDFVEEVVYDELNRVKEKLAPFDKDDERVRTPDRTLFGYDEVGNLVETSAPPSAGQTVRNVTINSYFDNGWMRASTDPWNIRTDYEYDEIGDQTSRTVTAAGGSSTRAMTWEYYPDGKLRSRKDDGVPVGKDVLVVDNSDPAARAEGDWGTAGSGSDHEGFDYRTHGAGSGGDTFTWQADVPRGGRYEVFVRYGRVATATNASYTVEHDGGTETRTVDQTQQVGEWVSLGSYGYTEDAVKKITLSDRADGTVVADAVKLVRDGTGEVDNEQKTHHYAYDVNGNLTEITDSSSAAAVSRYVVDYTTLNQVRRIDEVGAATKTTSYTYDLDHNLLTREHDAQSSAYTYDARNLLATVTNTGKTPGATPQTATFGYTDRAELATETKANGNTVRYEYYLDGLQRHFAETKPDGTVVNEHTMSYDANGQRTEDVAKTMNADDSSAYLDRVHTYAYDPVNRLRTSVKSDPAGAELERESYVHDANGNVVEQNLDGRTTRFTYDRNRLVSSSVDELTATHSYDPFGRLDKVSGAGEVLEKYRYDGFDRVVEHQQPKPGSADRTTIQYAYDPLDRTTARTTDGETTAFTYLGLSQEILTEQVGDALKKSYQYSPDGHRLSQTTHNDDGTTENAQYGYNPHTDVEQLTGPDGDTMATYGYTAYGKDDTEAFTGADKPDPQQPEVEPYNLYRFNGKRWDPTTGGYDMGFRDYNPGLNRFVTRDQYNGALADLSLGTSPWTGSRYAFTGGNPISRVEIDGHCWVWNFVCDAGEAVGDAAVTTGEAVATAGVFVWDVGAGIVEGGLDAASELSESMEACAGAVWDCATGAISQVGKMITDPAGTAKEMLDEAAAPVMAEMEDGNWGKAVGRSLFVGLETVLGGRILKNLLPDCGGNSFTGDTEVLMADGSRKPISEVREGDEVVATDPETGRTESRPVVAVIVGDGTKNLVDVTVDIDGAAGDATGSIVATDRHPFWVVDRGEWVDAADLLPGDEVLTPEGERLTVVTTREYTAVQRVHNLSIKDIHTYYVVADGPAVLVHNCPNRDPNTGGLDNTTFDAIETQFGNDIATGVDYNVQRMHDGSATAGNHDIPGIGHDPQALAAYLNSWRGSLTHEDSQNPGTFVGYDAQRGVLVVQNSYMIHAYRASEDTFLNGGRYVPR